MTRILKFTGALSCTLALSGAWAAPKDQDDVLLWVAAEVEISPEGTITALQWKDTRKAMKTITERIEPAVRAWRFEPGTVDGVPQPTVTHLSLRLRAVTNGDTVAIHVDHASTGAKSSLLAHPRYPVSAARANADAVLVANVAVSADGATTVESIDFRGNRPAYRRQFVEATQDAIAKWSFVPERVGGRPLATRMQIPVTFCITTIDCEHKYPAPDGESPRVGPPGQPVALESAVRLIDAVAGRAL
ncbi:energy transducer TonB [Cognatilysobacter bugurensis]|uniref:TonB C-terminal domain-containing protein n=1 Tax=Cognatilysobacter bugurensis TaxID=543356 RepID=A0A918W933_9GAMM|nr:energy transducer TonB [Lysobacter bugurensis]GHA83173.1 hypothetical protein GCM10007067_21610 [Lysobacter bugurensis]